MDNNFVDYTFVGSVYKYGDWFIDDIMDNVRNAKTDEDALWNIRSIMKEYEKRKTLKQKILSLFN